MAVIERPSEFNFGGGYFQNPIKYLISSANAFEQIQIQDYRAGFFVNTALQKQRVINGLANFDISSILQNIVSNSLPSFNTQNFEADATATATVTTDLEPYGFNLANAVSNELVANDFEGYVYQDASPAEISIPQRNLKFFKGFPSYFAFYAANYLGGVSINVSDDTGLLANFTIPALTYSISASTFGLLTKYYLDLFFQNPTSNIGIEIVGSSQIINFEYVDLGACESSLTCLGWFNELGAFETFVFESYRQIQYEQIAKSEFFGSNKRISSDLQKVIQSKNIIQPLISKTDLDNILSLWTSNEVYIFEEGNFSPIQIVNKAPAYFENTQNKEVPIEFVRQIQNR